MPSNPGVCSHLPKQPGHQAGNQKALGQPGADSPSPPSVCMCVCVCPPIKGDGERGWGAPPPTSHSKRVRDKSQQYNINFILKNKTQSTGPVPQGT